MSAPRRGVLALNSGSSSVKYRLVEVGTGRTAASGVVERVDRAGHPAAVAEVLASVQSDDAPTIAAVGHRVVHGGAEFTDATLLDPRVEERIDALAQLAPLHNPPALAGIRAARAALPDVPAVAVFDTAFHAHLPAAARTYAIDRDVAARHGIRRFGFHGISYRYVAGETARALGRPLAELRMIVLHLGNGASAAAIAAGRSVDTSMGFTPAEGLVMGTRGGDIDPGVLVHLARSGMSPDEIDDLLQRRSGLRGLAGSGDMRDVVAAADSGDPAAVLALEVYVHRLRKYVGAYAAVLGRIDALVFTAGVGENSPLVRSRTVNGLDLLGLRIDADANAAPGTRARVISPEGASVPVLVVPTDEELEIARRSAEVARLGPVAGDFRP